MKKNKQGDERKINKRMTIRKRRGTWKEIKRVGVGGRMNILVASAR